MVTFWGSTYSMSSNIIEQAISAVLASDHKNWHKMPSDAVVMLEYMCAVSEPLSFFTDALTGEKHVTVSAVHPLLDHIPTSIVPASPDDFTVVKQKKKIIREDLTGCYSAHTTLLLDKCSFHDPRCLLQVCHREGRSSCTQIKDEAVESLYHFQQLI